MKHTIQYTLNVDVEAMQAAIEHCLPDNPRLSDTSWVNICGVVDEDESKYKSITFYASITFPSPNHPELNCSLFWRIACKSLPISKHVETGIFFSVYEETERQGRVVSELQFTDRYQPFRSFH